MSPPANAKLFLIETVELCNKEFICNCLETKNMIREEKDSSENLLLSKADTVKEFISAEIFDTEFEESLANENYKKGATSG
jgi:hypothetical protein